MHRRDISAALFATAAGSALLAKRAEAQTCTAPCYPQTRQESAAITYWASQTPPVTISVADTSYPPGYVDRYLKNTNPGMTDMAPGFSTAFKFATYIGFTIRFGATAPYAIKTPINYTTSGSPAQYGVTTHYDGGSTPSRLPLVATVGRRIGSPIDSHVFDCTGTAELIFENVGIYSIGSDTGFFLARNSATGASVEGARFMNCVVAGAYGTACYYNCCAEGDQIVGGYWTNTTSASGPKEVTGPKVLLYTFNNIADCQSAYQGTISTATSCIDHSIFGGEFYNESSNAQADVVSIEACNGVKIFGSWMYCADPATGRHPGNGRSLVFVDLTHGPSNFCTLHSITGEEDTSYQQKYGVLFGYTNTPTQVHTCEFWNIDSCTFPNETYAIATVNSSYAPTLSDFHIRNINDPQSHGIQLHGALQKSTIDESAIDIKLYTVNNCSFTVDTSLTSATSTITNLAITEGGTTNRKWTPTAVTGVSGISTASYNCSFVGPQFTFNIIWQTTSGITCSAGATVTLNTHSGGLTARAIADSPVPVVNGATYALIGYGYVTGTTLVLPAINVGATGVVLIAGSYYVS